MAIGEVVKAWRVSRNYSQEHLAGLIGVSQPLLSDFEAGRKALGAVPAMKLHEISAHEIAAEDCVHPDKKASTEALLAMMQPGGERTLEE